jgi:CDP-paratose 2-epimerase
VYNVGGGSEVSLSLRETTALCQEITGNHVEVSSNPTTRAGDVRIYISDCTALRQRTGWRPTRSARQILGDIYTWIHTYEDSLKPALLRD